MRRVIAGALLTLSAAWGVRAEPVQPDQRILFTPAPLGAVTGGFQRDSSLQPPLSAPPATPAPKPRPSIRPTANAASPPRANLPKVDLAGAIGGSGRTAVLAAPQPQALDFSRGVDLGGMSLGLANHDGGSGSGGTGLVTLDTKTPIPTDPALAARQNVIPYFGLSLSAPTN
jgi:hypothetical protein